MISLKEAIKLTELSMSDICFLKNEGGNRHDMQILTVREITNTFDMKRTMVTRILPRFSSFEYEGVEFTIRRRQ